MKHAEVYELHWHVLQIVQVENGVITDTAALTWFKRLLGYFFNFLAQEIILQVFEAFFALRILTCILKRNYQFRLQVQGVKLRNFPLDPNALLEL